jgi:hypothetical protein
MESRVCRKGDDNMKDDVCLTMGGVFSITVKIRKVAEFLDLATAQISHTELMTKPANDFRT